MGNRCPCVIMSIQVWDEIGEELETMRSQRHDDNIQMINLEKDVIALRNQLKKLTKVNPQDP